MLKNTITNIYQPLVSVVMPTLNQVQFIEIAVRSILEQAYARIELIVVDGAYEWMAPFLRSTGRNPLKSDDIIYQKIQASGIPYKVINKIWKNEVEKRIAGII